MRLKHMRPTQSVLSSLSLFAVVISTSLVSPSVVEANEPVKTYRNPLLEPLNMADPHVIKVGDTYYMYPTWNTRQYDVFISDDLVNWKHHGPVYTNDRKGLWAPEVFHNVRGDGKFYLYFTDNMPDFSGAYNEKQIGVAVSDSPLGPFEDKKIFVTHSIDAHVFQDDDGKLYFYYANIRDGFKIMGQEMENPLTLKGEPKVLLQPTEPWEMSNGHVTEGPFILKHNGTYYLTYSGTGADSPNYAIGYATSKSPLGPFKKYEKNPIVKRHGDLYGPGHHCVVEGPDGNLWMLYHQKRDDERNFRRYLALDRLWFDENGVLHGKATKGTDEPAPVKKATNVSRK